MKYGKTLKSILAATILLALVGCGANNTVSPMLSSVSSKMTAKAKTTTREEAYQVVKTYFVEKYNQHVFSMQFGLEAPYAFAVAIGEDAMNKVKYLGTYDQETGKIQIDDVLDVGSRF
ncbi:MAG TPA: hypothetical protein DD435_13740 [Cyanobacteria bacterium UBA8530]|nr:hypothetical protein [Cyanobacteria bacterium UBA8530]